jgi:hypothetical protein
MALLSDLLAGAIYMPMQCLLLSGGLFHLPPAPGCRNLQLHGWQPGLKLLQQADSLSGS